MKVGWVMLHDKNKMLKRLETEHDSDFVCCGQIKCR
jgi:hypothetical protein